MPQLMPFYWVNSVFMVFFVLFTLVIFYFYKNMEMFSGEELSEGESFINNYLW